MKKLIIKKLFRKTINTKFGEKDKYSVIFSEKPDQYFDSFVGDWNSAWRIGDVIEVADDQWQEPSDPKYNWTIRAPKDAKFGVGRKEFNEYVAMTDKRIADLAERVSALEASPSVPQSPTTAANTPY